MAEHIDKRIADVSSMINVLKECTKLEGMTRRGSDVLLPANLLVSIDKIKHNTTKARNPIKQ